jgi:NitT/TauT family transport system permease protein
LRYLQFPSALPNTIAGLKVGISLSLIGTVVGQFLLSNSKSNGGIAYILMQSEYNLKTSLLFAALFLLIISGALLYIIADKIGSLLTSRWHESEVQAN